MINDHEGWIRAEGGSQRATDPCFGIDDGVVSQQHADDLQLVRARGQVQCRFPAHRWGIGVGAMLQQQQHDVHVAHES